MLLIDKLARSRSLTGTRCLLSGALLIKPGSIFGLPPQAVSQSLSLAVSALLANPAAAAGDLEKYLLKIMHALAGPAVGGLPGLY